MNQSTKEKILNVANGLFAVHGYHGTSIRDIAKEADINIASVNYHFNNKLNLYQEVFKRNYEYMDKRIKEMADSGDSKSFADFSWAVYKFFEENSNAITNSFKIILTNDVSCEEFFKEKDDFGPPGQQAFLKFIDSELPLGAKLWTVRTLFSNIIHNAVVMNTSICKSKMNEVPYMNEKYFELSIKSTAQALLDHAKANPRKFEI